MRACRSLFVLFAFAAGCSSGTVGNNNPSDSNTAGGDSDTSSGGVNCTSGPDGCDGLDNDCDGQYDEDCACPGGDDGDGTDDNGCDDDGDDAMTGVGTPAICPNSPADSGDDCDDSSAAANPGVSTETYGDGADNNCDGLLDYQDPASCSFMAATGRRVAGRPNGPGAGHRHRRRGAPDGRRRRRGVRRAVGAPRDPTAAYCTCSDRIRLTNAASSKTRKPA